MKSCTESFFRKSQFAGRYHQKYSYFRSKNGQNRPWEIFDQYFRQFLERNSKKGLRTAIDTNLKFKYRYFLKRCHVWFLLHVAFYKKCDKNEYCNRRSKLPQPSEAKPEDWSRQYHSKSESNHSFILVRLQKLTRTSCGTALRSEVYHSELCRIRMSEKRESVVLLSAPPPSCSEEGGWLALI